MNTARLPPDVSGMSNWDAKMNVSSTYRFALVIENSIAEGYVTEKLYQILTAGAVPVYLGDPNILEKVPNRTAIILINDYPSLEKLAEKLDELMDDDVAYEKYLEWKKWPFQETWVDLERMAHASWKCRVAMHVAGRKYVFRTSKDWGKTREVFEEKGDVFDREAGEVCPTQEELARGGGGARGGWGACRTVVEEWDREHPPGSKVSEEVLVNARERTVEKRKEAASRFAERMAKEGKILGMSGRVRVGKKKEAKERVASGEGKKKKSRVKLASSDVGQHKEKKEEEKLTLPIKDAAAETGAGGEAKKQDSQQKQVIAATKDAKSGVLKTAKKVPADKKKPVSGSEDAGSSDVDETGRPTDKKARGNAREPRGSEEPEPERASEAAEPAAAGESEAEEEASEA